MKRKFDAKYYKMREEAIFQLIKVYGCRCWYCGRRFADDNEISLEHIIPVSKGGTDDLENLALSCGFCNRCKFGHDAEDFVTHYLAHIRSSSFECLMLDRLKLDSTTHDILRKSFY